MRHGRLRHVGARGPAVLAVGHCHQHQEGPEAHAVEQELGVSVHGSHGDVHQRRHARHGPSIRPDLERRAPYVTHLKYRIRRASGATRHWIDKINGMTRTLIEELDALHVTYVVAVNEAIEADDLTRAEALAL